MGASIMRDVIHDPEPWHVSTDLLIEQPSPGMPSPQGFVGLQVANLEKLEESAQTLSRGSNLGHEIRKMSMEQKRRDSRRSSVKSIRSNRTSQRLSQHSHSRHASNASSAHMSADTYSAIRWSSFHPTAPDSPPVMSIVSQSSGWNQLPSRTSSSSSAGTARHEPSNRTDDGYEHILSPTASCSSDGARSPPLLASYQNSLFSTMRGSQNTASYSGSSVSTSQDALRVQNKGTHLRSSSLASVDTHYMGTAFRDFDGIHYSPVHERLEEEEENKGLGLKVPATIEEAVEPKKTAQEKPERERTTPAPATIPRKSTTPLPGERNLVFYPAPVPMRINLPKRLTKPKGPFEPQRRMQAMNHLSYQDRRSTIWPPQSPSSEKGQRKSVQTMAPNRQSAIGHARLPPHLRAAVFFDEPSVAHDVAIQHGSAVATLESMLDAAARAPVAHTQTSAHNDYQQSNPLNSRSGMSAMEIRGSRSSVVLVRSSPDQLDGLPESSRLSLSDDIGTESVFEVDFGMDKDQSETLEKTTAGTTSSPLDASKGPIEKTHVVGEYGTTAEEASEEGGVRVPSAELPLAPKTLLAELETRKQQLRLRTRTAATAGPEGMHSTLLEQDAVAEVEEKNRKAKRTMLAWEDPDESDGVVGYNDEDDIPLAVLYANEKDMLGPVRDQSDWKRPLGLIERRAFEDSEPLSSRRTRLRSKALPPLPLFSRGFEEEETLAQRTRRLKAAQATTRIDNPLRSGPRVTSELIANGIKRNSTIRLLPAAASPSPHPSEEESETLGQRRRRLHLEANANMASRRASLDKPMRPEQPRRSSSFADLLNAHPISSIHLPQTQSQPGSQTEANPVYAAKSSGLLDQSIQMQSQRKARLASTAQNLRASSYVPQTNSAMQQHQQQAAATYGLWPEQPLQQTTTYYVQQSQTAQAITPYMKQSMYPSYTSLVPAQVKPSSTNVVDPAISTTQRTNIDRWRMSVQ